MPKKHSVVASKPRNEIRSSALQNGLYFYLLDMLNTDQRLKNYLKNLGVVTEHSVRVGATQRNAFFLQIPEAICAERVFDATEKKLKGIHITVDRDYLESNDTQLADRMKWHYCHYTEVYTDGTTIHVYLDSNATILSKKITYPGNRTEDLSQTQATKIDNNLHAAWDIIMLLLCFKREQVNIESNLESIMLKDLINNAKSGYVDLELIKKIQDKRILAQRYADVGLIFSTTDLAEMSKYNVEHIEQSASTTSATETVEATPLVSKAKLSDKDKTKIEKELARNNLEIIKDKCSLLFKAIHENRFVDLLNIEELRTSVIELYYSYNGVVAKECGILLDSLDKFNIKVMAFVKSKVSGAVGSLEFLKKNFIYIDQYLDEDYFKEIITLATNATSPKKQEELRDICKFLYDRSITYRNTIKKAHLIEKSEDLSLLFDWVVSCNKENNSETFMMLLLHGVTLDTTLEIDKTDTNELDFSLFRLAFNKFATNYHSQITGSHNESQVDNENDSQKSKYLSNFIKFVDIMTDERFFVGGEYERVANATLKRAEKEARLHSLISRSRVTSSSRMRQSESKIGMLGVFDFAVKMSLPDQVINLLANRIEPEKADFGAILVQMGRIMDANYEVIIINESITEDSNTILGFARNNLVILDNDHFHFMSHYMINRIESTDRIFKPIFYLVNMQPNPEHADSSFAAASLSAEHSLYTSLDFYQRIQYMLTERAVKCSLNDIIGLHKEVRIFLDLQDGASGTNMDEPGALDAILSVLLMYKPKPSELVAYYSEIMKTMLSRILLTQDKLFYYLVDVLYDSSLLMQKKSGVSKALLGLIENSGIPYNDIKKVSQLYVSEIKSAHQKMYVDSDEASPRASKLSP